MGNYLLLVALAAIVSIASLLHSTRQSSLGTDKQLAHQTFKSVVAREAALTGLNLTLHRLAADTSSWADDPSVYEFTGIRYRRARFTTRVSSDHLPGPVRDRCHADTVDVIATGIPDAETSGRTSHQIEGAYVRTCRLTEHGSGNADAVVLTWDAPTWILGGFDPTDTSDDSEPDSLFVAKGLGLVEYAEW